MDESWSEMKLEENFQIQPAGKGKIPVSQKQASQFAYYDTIMGAWRFPKPLNPSYIEKLCVALTGKPHGINLDLFLEVIQEMNELRDLDNPFGFLRWKLMKRLNAK